MTMVQRIVILLAAASLAGCMVSEIRPEEYTPAVQAQTDVPEAQLLDVGIAVFDPGLPERGDDPEEGIFRNVREAEARYVPSQLKDTLQGTGHWGMVRVVPERSEAMDVHVSGRIEQSDGEVLALQVAVRDSTNRLWFEKEYRARADSSVYADSAVLGRDPFQSVYNVIANDMLAFRETLPPEAFTEIRRVSELKYARSLSPESFEGYLEESRDGKLKVVRLPARDDPMLERVRRIREREYMFIDTLNEHYGTFEMQMSEPYENWRKFTYEEIIARREVERTAMFQKILGVAAIAGAFAVQENVGSSIDESARAVLIAGGIEMLRAGFQTGKEARIHADALAELGESFSADIQPVVVEVQGETRRLQGSAETQYHEWRKLLKEIYATETGFETRAPDIVPEGAAAPDGT
ncbi:MAG: hypothetical protein P8080_00145 [Gammaproteobacteria bacterium]